MSNKNIDFYASLTESLRKHVNSLKEYFQLFEPGIFRKLDYDLDAYERRATFMKYDYVLCEKCNRKFDNHIMNRLYCRYCYSKETDRNEKMRMYYGICKVCFQINFRHPSFFKFGCLFCNIEQLLKDFDKWNSKIKVITDDIIPKEPKVGISDYDLDENDRQMKYKSYDCVLCEKCDQKFYYYCYDCYDKETEELKKLRSDLQDYEDFYCKLYDKGAKVSEKIESILRDHKNICSKSSSSYEVFPFQIEKVLEQTMVIKSEIENRIIRIKNIKYDELHGSSGIYVKKVKNGCTIKVHSYCDCYDEETDSNEKKRMKFGKCKECFQINEGLGDCLSCKPRRFQRDFDKWTSGNKVIDKIIQDNQLLPKRHGLLEWISYNKFTNIKYIAKGGFAKVYSATWIDGPIKRWSQFSNNWMTKGSLPIALKVFNDSENINEDFLNEIKFFNKVSDRMCVIKCFGITQDPITRDYALVLQYMENGDLRSYLKRTVNSLSWKQRMNNIYDICLALSNIHNEKIIHKDLHPGNVFIDSPFSYIGDFGFCMPANENSTQKNIYGVMPYIAPEILRGKSHTLASDVYSLSIIINEIITVVPPFHNQPHDCILALDICQGLRPTIRAETPDSLKELIEKCWDANPEKRPTSKEIFNEFSSHLDEYKSMLLKKLSYNFNESTTNSSSSLTTKLYETHPQAIYTSRLLSFQNLPKPINCSNQQGFVSLRNIVKIRAGDTLHSDCLDCAIID